VAHQARRAAEYGVKVGRKLSVDMNRVKARKDRISLQSRTGGEAATFFGVPEEDFTLISGEPKAFYFIAPGKGLYRKFCPQRCDRVFNSNLESFPGMIFVTLGSLDKQKELRNVAALGGA